MIGFVRSRFRSSQATKEGGIVDNCLTLENRRTGEVLRMRRVHDSGRIILILEGALPAGADGPPLHVHTREHEEGIVKAGTLGAIVGREKITVPAGQPV